MVKAVDLGVQACTSLILYVVDHTTMSRLSLSTCDVSQHHDLGAADMGQAQSVQINECGVRGITNVCREGVALGVPRYESADAPVESLRANCL